MSRRSLIAATLGLLLAIPALAACGEDRSDGAEAPASARVVEGAYGEIEIPAEPKRIVADPMTVDYLTALGYDTTSIVGVFGAASYAEDENHYLDDALDWESMVDPGYAFEANLEEIAAANPDHVTVNPVTSDKGAIGVTLLRELGFEQPQRLDTIKPDEWGAIDISAENISLLGGDLLFLEVREGASRHEKSPLWKTLGVVQNDRVVTVGNHWEFGGAVGARAVIEDIDTALDEL